jgi:FMN phosphatase YigB (HAD superfamily)
MYYRELFDRTGFDPTKCLMVGNNVGEDMIAQELGCDVYLILRNLINPNHTDIQKFKQGDLDSLIEYLDQNK